MLVKDDPGARRNRGSGRGLWAINILVSMLVAVLSLYAFRAADTRADARAAFAAVEALPGQLGGPAALADVGPDPGL